MERKAEHNCRKTIPAVAGLVILAALTAVSLLYGISGADGLIITHIRLPRVLTAILAGASLSMAGTQMQSIFRNPLADPHIMGVSSGAALGAATATMWGGRAAGGIIGGLPVASAAFAGAILSSVIILTVSRKFRNAGTLLIFGVMLGFIVNAIVSIMQAGTDAESLKMFYSWSAGSFSTSTWGDIILIAAAMLVSTAIALKNRKGLDIILFGDEFARMAGAEPEKIRIRALLSCSIVAGTVTAFCGPIGFIGIVAPHVARGICRTSSHSAILPISLLTGSIISLTADFLSRITPSPLPIASTMALLGIPIILYILIKGTPA